MSHDDEPHDQKKTTAATTDAPQEEFISPEPPSKPDPDAKEKSPPDSEAPKH